MTIRMLGSWIVGVSAIMAQGEIRSPIHYERVVFAPGSSAHSAGPSVQSWGGKFTDELGLASGGLKIFWIAKREGENAFLVDETSGARGWVRSSFVVGLSEALPLYRRQAVLNGGNARIHNCVAILCRELQNFPEAIREHNKAIEMSPREAEAFIHRGDTWFTQGEVSRALDDYNEALRRTPTDLSAMLRRAKIWRLMGELDRMLVDVNESLRLHPGNAMSLIAKGDYFVATLEHGKAIECYSEAIRTDGFLRLYVKWPSVYVSRALCFASLGDSDRALEGMSEVVREEPRNPWNFYWRAVLYRRKQKSFDSAIADIDQMIAMERDDAAGYVLRAMICADAQRYKDVSAALTTAIKLDFRTASGMFLQMKPAEVYVLRADALMMLGKPRDATVDYGKAMELNPGGEGFHFKRAASWAASGRMDEAVRDYDEELRRSPRFAQPRDAEAYKSRARANFALKRCDAAITDLDKCLDLRGDDIEALELRGAAWILKKQIEKGLVDFGRVIEIDPRRPSVFTNRGKAWMLLEKLDNASWDFDSAIVVNPADSEAFRLRGRIRLSTGDRAGADSDFREAERLSREGGIGEN